MLADSSDCRVICNTEKGKEDTFSVNWVFYRFGEPVFTVAPTVIHDSKESLFDEVFQMSSALRKEMLFWNQDTLALTKERE